MPLPSLSERAAIADAVALALTRAPAGTFAQPLATVARKYLPAAELADLKELTVTVVPLGPEERPGLANRSAVWKDLVVQIGIQKRLTQGCDPTSPAGNAELDALQLVTEQIAAFFEPNQAEGRTGDLTIAIPETTVAWIRTAIDPAYDVDHLLTQRTFTSVIHLTFRRA